MYSKRGNRFSRFEELRQRICRELPRRELILDGEIVAINPDGFVDFYAMMRGGSHLAYVAFEVLWLNGRDLRGLPLVKRKQALKRLIPKASPTLLRVPASRSTGAPCSRPRAGWISRGSWRSGRLTHTAGDCLGIRSRIQHTLRLRAEGSCSSGVRDRRRGRPPCS
jgi:hypothetical protein